VSNVKNEPSFFMKLSK